MTIINRLAEKFDQIRTQSVAPILAQKWQEVSGKFTDLTSPQLPQLNLTQRFSDFTKDSLPVTRWQNAYNQFKADAPKRLADTQARIGYSLDALGNRFQDFLGPIPQRLNEGGQGWLDTLQQPRGTIPRLGFNLAKGLAETGLENITIGSPEQREINRLSMKPDRTPAENQRLKDQMIREGSDLAMGFVSPVGKLDNLLGYSDDLFRRGYRISQVEKIGTSEGGYLLANNIGPKDWAAAKAKRLEGPTTKWSKTSRGLRFELWPSLWKLRSKLPNFSWVGLFRSPGLTSNSTAMALPSPLRERSMTPA